LILQILSILFEITQVLYAGSHFARVRFKVAQLLVLSNSNVGLNQARCAASDSASLVLIDVNYYILCPDL